MKRYLMLIVVLFTIISCKNKETRHTSTTQNNCAKCHSTIQTHWADLSDLHTISSTNILVEEVKTPEELFKKFCLYCHSYFQSTLGFENTETNPNTINSSSCMEQNNANLKKSDSAKIAKFKSLLEGHSKTGTKKISNLSAAYQKIISSTGDTSTYFYPNQTSLTVKITKFCCSCHNPIDQGSEPAITKDSIDFGPQGGNSRIYVMENHKGFGCSDCHNSSDFMAIEPSTKSSCNSCHPTPNSQTGKVHINNL